MKTEVPHQTPEQAANQETAPLDLLPADSARDSFLLLDHRGRARAIPPRLARRGPYLAFTHGDELRLVPLAPTITHIGRGLNADLRFEDHRVSRSHAIIVRHGRFARLLDDRSSNGTFLNGRRVLATNLHDGDVIQIGPATTRYIEIG
jgi:hypothetical protein